MDVSLVAAYLFLVFSILVLIKLFISKQYEHFFWFCDFSPFILAAAFFLGNMQLVLAVINLGLSTQLIAFPSLIYGLISGMDVAGSKEALSFGKFYTFVDILIHISSPLALIFVLDIYPEKISLVYSFILLSGMFLFTLAFTSVKSNTNLIYHIEVSPKKRIKLPYHTKLWIVYSFLVVLITFLIMGAFH